MEAHVDDVSLGTNTQEDHILLLQEFFTVCEEKNLRIKLRKCEFMREVMEYLGFDVRYAGASANQLCARSRKYRQLQPAQPKLRNHGLAFLEFQQRPAMMI